MDTGYDAPLDPELAWIKNVLDSGEEELMRLDMKIKNSVDIRRAVRDDQVDKVRAIIGNNLYYDQRTYDWCIVRAAYNGNAHIMEIFLKNGHASPSIYNNMPLRVAVMCGHTETVALLLKDKRVDPAAQRNTPLSLAVTRGLDNITALLLAEPCVVAAGIGNELFEPAQRFTTKSLNKGLDELSIDTGFDAPLASEIATIQEVLDCGELELAQAEGDWGIGHVGEIRRAVRDGQEDKVCDLLAPPNFRFDIRTLDWCMLHAAFKGNTRILEILLKNGHGSPYIYHNMPLRAAVMCGHTETVALLLKDRRVDPAALQNTPLVLAAKGGLDDVVRLLLAEPRVVASGIEIAMRAAAHYQTTTSLLDGVSALSVEHYNKLTPGQFDILSQIRPSVVAEQIPTGEEEMRGHL
jgi:ankyrin repeat protein